MVRRLAFVLMSNLLVFGFFSPALSQSNDRPPWSERGVFVAGSYVLDFQRHVEVSDGRRGSLENCSTAELYCASGLDWRVAFPRACVSMRVGDRWEREGVATVVLGVERETYVWRVWLAQPERPRLIFEYQPEEGIVGALEVDADGARVAAAREGRLRGLIRLTRAYTQYHRLRTLDPMGRCQGPPQDRAGTPQPQPSMSSE